MTRPLLLAALALGACTPATTEPGETPVNLAPAVVFTSPNGQVLETVDATVEARILDAEAAGVRWLQDGDVLSEQTGPLEVDSTVSVDLTLHAGPNVIGVEVLDSQGVTDAREIVVVLDAPDAPDAPVLALGSPAADDVVDASRVRIQGTVLAEEEPTRAEVLVDGESTTLDLSESPAGVWSFDVELDLPYGSTTLVVEIEDSAGRLVSETRTVSRVDDEAPPVLDSLWPTDGHGTASTATRVWGIASDNDGLASVEIEQDGVRSPATLAADGSFSGSLTLGRGQQSYSVVLTDLSGNETVETRSVHLGSRVAAGGSHSGLVDATGGLYAWGRNNTGQAGLGYTSSLGDTDPAHPDVPMAATLGTEPIVSIAFFQNTSVALDASGAVWGWGDNADGRLGLGTASPDDAFDEEDRSLPTSVPGLTDVVTVAGGYYHTLALRSDGSVSAMGRNSEGQLGDGSSEDRDHAVQVAGLSGIVQIAAASSSSFAVDGSGVLYAWGANDYAQLGTGVEDDDVHGAPIAVAGLPPIVQVAAGKDHVLALDENGQVWGWGLNASNQIGGASNGIVDTPVLSPTALSHLGTSVAVYANGNQSYHETADGLLWGWGQNGSTGALGVSATGDLDAPIAPVFGLTDVVDAGIGALHTVALRQDGAAFAWGWSFQGSLGAGDSAINAWGYKIPILVSLP